MQTNPKSKPAKSWPSPKGGLRGSKAVPAGKYRPAKKGMKNEC